MGTNPLRVSTWAVLASSSGLKRRRGTRPECSGYQKWAPAPAGYQSGPSLHASSSGLKGRRGARPECSGYQKWAPNTAGRRSGQS
ncbi:unnamed protein product [Sphagnum troendelagicum]